MISHIGGRDGIVAVDFLLNLEAPLNVLCGPEGGGERRDAREAESSGLNGVLNLSECITGVEARRR